MKARTMLLLLGFACAMQARAHGGLIDLSVYDRTDGKRLAVYWHEGRAYVVGKPGNEYQVSVKNRLREDVLAIVSVDGVNVISGETAHPGQTGYVLSSYQGYNILGWRKSLAETAAFYFTALPDSYAARTGRPDNVGVIGVAVFRERARVVPLEELKPRDTPRAEAQSAPAPAARAQGNAAAGDAAESAGRVVPDRLGTGHGRSESSYASYTQFERASAAPTETITIYYDSYENLLAQGVPVATPPIARFRPDPFPDRGRFVPDPVK